MTNSEFEQYLESIGGLTNAYNIDGAKITYRGHFSVGDGWLDLVKDLIDQLISLGWNKSVTQVKEKFGGLRFYICSSTDEIDSTIDLFEQVSYTICEDCGKEGKLRNDLHWIRTLCDEHYSERKENK